MTRRKNTSESVEDLGSPNSTPIEGKTETQKRYISAIKSFKLIFATGSAGTGKTWLATAMAAQALMNGRTDKVILTRPAVEAGESLGFLPGEINDKFEPYLQPFKQVLYDRLGKGRAECMMKNGKIQAIPLAYLRGITFQNCYVILDEAQNTTPTEMKMFLTRIGENCTVIVNGDTTQKDIRGESGLIDAIERIGFLPSVKVINFTKADIVRSGLVQEIVEAYERPKEDKRPSKEYKRFYGKEIRSSELMLEPTPYVEEREDPLGQFLFKKIREVVIKK
ncbi:PhoH family protein [Parasutterella muris]|uniref:PhoH family protein n=1 Tax=Parasutterella muris TaxID=2565572 RepID=UPI00203E9456|nr:PhoH family protein [Parasutterella muris]